MKNLPSLILLSAASILAASCGRAAVDPSIIPADARWVVYADLNGLRASTVGKELVAMGEKAQAEANNVIGIDIQKAMATVGTITGYGANFSHDPKSIDGMIVLQGTSDLRKIAESVLLQGTIASPDTVAESKELPFPAYTVRPKHAGNTPGDTIIVAFPPEPVVLVSKSAAQIQKARDALRGKIPTVAKTPDAPLKPLLRASSEGYVFAASIVPPDEMFPDDQPQARVLKMANSGSLTLGEKAPNTFAHAQLIASSDEMADKITKILQGIIAAMSLTETNDKQLAEFMNSTTVTRDERTVTLRLAYSSERLAQMIHSAQEAQAHRRTEDGSAMRSSHLIDGEPIAQWKAEAVAGQPEAPLQLMTRTIENVALKNGTVLSLGRQSNGGKTVRFNRVEVTPVSGGSPLVFQAQYLRNGGPHGNLLVLAFPGTDGAYNIKVAYQNDPTGKATYAVSLRNPKPVTTEAEPASAEPPAAADAKKP